MCRAACVLLALLASACSPSDEASPLPTPTSPTLPTPPTSPTPPDERLQLSGRVLDQNSTPVPGVLVTANYGGNSPSSPCHVADQPCWLARRTNDLGEYLLEFDARTWPGRGSGFVYTFREGYEVDVQWVPTGPPRGSGPAGPCHAQHSCWRVDCRLGRRHELALHRPRGSVGHGQAM
jgi:hypothetical protein